MQRLRDGVAHFAITNRPDILASSEVPPDWVIITISFDDTFEELLVGNDMGPQHVMMMQGQVVFRFNDDVVKEDPVVPTAVITFTSTGAENLFAVLKRRFPLLFDKIGGKFVVIVNTDSAASCLRVGRHFCSLAMAEPARYHLHSTCMQHMGTSSSSSSRRRRRSSSSSRRRSS